MQNFLISCESPKIADYWNFESDIRYYPAAHQEALKKGFFAVYNLSLALLELKSVEVINPELN